MSDAQLLHLASEDRKGLTDEALMLLKEEFAKRSLDVSVLDPIEMDKEPQREEDREPIAGFYNPSTSAEDALLGRNYLSIKNPAQEATMAESQQRFVNSLNPDDIRILIKKAENSMLANGLIFFAGLLITIISFLAVAEKGGLYFLAWGPMLFGGYRFIRAFDNKNKYRVLLKIASIGSNDDPPASH